MTVAAVRKSTEVARPLKILVPLIKDEIDAGDKAGIEHYRRAGEMLLEAKEQVGHGEWRGWVERNFHLSLSTAQRYMTLVEMPRARGFTSLRQATGQRGGGKVSWQQPVQEIAARVNVEALARDQLDREREQKMLHQLGHQLIDIGYKVLSAKLHPDKGGSSEAMSRLNKVRSILKEAI